MTGCRMNGSCGSLLFYRKLFFGASRAVKKMDFFNNFFIGLKLHLYTIEGYTCISGILYISLTVAGNDVSYVRKNGIINKG